VLRDLELPKANELTLRRKHRGEMELEIETEYVNTHNEHFILIPTYAFAGIDHFNDFCIFLYEVSIAFSLSSPRLLLQYHSLCFSSISSIWVAYTFGWLCWLMGCF
jgi:hypothetical protein